MEYPRINTYSESVLFLPTQHPLLDRRKLTRLQRAQKVIFFFTPAQLYWGILDKETLIFKPLKIKFAKQADPHPFPKHGYFLQSLLRKQFETILIRYKRYIKTKMVYLL